MRKRFPPLTLLCLAAAAAITQAHAIGLGSVPAAVVLGQPLDMAIPVHLEPSEHLSSQCVQAQVLMGDTPLAPGQAKARLETRGEGAAARTLVRVTTSVVVSEPLVTVDLSLGCPARLTRQIVAFADPPDMQAARHVASTPAPLALPAVSSAPVAKPSTAVAEQALPGPPRASARAKSSKAAKATAVAKATTKPTAKVAKLVAKAPKPQKTAHLEGKAARPASPPKVASAPSSADHSARPRLSASIIDASVDLNSRLRLDTYDRSPGTAESVAKAEQSLAKMEASAAAAMAASDAMLTLQGQRVEILERDLKRARTEAADTRSVNAKLRSRLDDAESYNQLLPVAGGLAALGLGLAGWLGWRLRRMQQERKQAWWNSSEAEAAERASAEPDYALAEPKLLDLGTNATALQTELSTASTSSLVPSTGSVPEPPPATDETHTTDDEDLSAGISSANIESLIDLEQQVEFFAVLGQEDSAIELLGDFLKTHGADAPLVHLRLLEAHHRKGDEAAYEKARARMARLFGGQAPAWAQEWSAGRALEDYPEVMERVNDAWSTPVQAMSELEGVMFNAKGQPAMDLAAYRDALVLYATLRDKEDAHDQDLPLGTSSAPSAASALPALAATAGATQTQALESVLPVAGATQMAPAVDNALEWIASEMGSLSGQGNEPAPALSLPFSGANDLDFDLPRIDLAALGSVPSPTAGSTKGANDSLSLDLDLSDPQLLKPRGEPGELTVVDPTTH